MRVLLADDHQLLRQAIRRALEDAGMTVIAEAGDGGEAVRMVAELKPDVVVMDVSMPVLDGVEATRRVHEEFPELPIVILTMHGDDALRRDAVAAGATGFLTKDVSMQEVVATVTQAVGGDVALSTELAATILAELEDGNDKPPSPLTPREQEVLQLIADGCSTSEVAVEPLHQRQDGEEPPRLDLREARGPRPDAGGALRGPDRHHSPSLKPSESPSNRACGADSRQMVRQAYSLGSL